jgi:uncharacterized repeat protein (TIGR03803 family)
MKRLANIQVLVAELAAGLCLALLPNQLAAQPFTTLHTFPATALEGVHPNALLPAGNVLYGTAYAGGSGGSGTVFKMNTDGSGFTNLYSFSPGGSDPTVQAPTNSDGDGPTFDPLVLSGDTLYGTTYFGGSNGGGTIFAVNTDGTGFTTLYTFSPPPHCCGAPTNSDGSKPNGGLVLSGSTLYGTTAGGGLGGWGTVFAINTDGTAFTTLYAAAPNSAGGNPNGGLILSGNTLYGTAKGYGDVCPSPYTSGSVFAISTNGSGYRVLHTFAQCYGPGGTLPLGGLLLSGNTLYGTTSEGGLPNGGVGDGTVFAVNTSGAGFTTLHSFNSTNGEGRYPTTALALTDYGVCGATSGTIFTLKTNGTGFLVLNTAVAGPVVSTGTALYVAAPTGPGNGGTIVTMSAIPTPPQLTITSDGADGYLIHVQGLPAFSCELQRASSLAGPWATSSQQRAGSNGVIVFHELFKEPGQEFYRTVQ